ncbi:hypothetical protein [Sphingobium yanoikuyae]|uniref:hypothetical protein n=1 Tax=Sphingobium yanoikuyae TaxID=13690 RepID=UPI000262C0F0|nr:hypothetical protein [Sphingobium yanoikuyae]
MINDQIALGAAMMLLRRHGQLVGALYGEAGIPQAWRDGIVGYERIGKMADQLLTR